ncbi:MAG: transposase [Flavisolibacter sp.]|nr:transposase [Flavisolibacter sp.]
MRGGKVLQVSHDEVNRFLTGNNFTGKDLFERAKAALNLSGGVLSVDDTVIDKPYSNPAATELIGFFWSGLHHRSVRGINLIMLNYTDPDGVSLPVNWRVYRRQDSKTKNDYFQDMVTEVFHWGLRPGWVTADCWYSSIENLKFLRNKEVGFLVGLEKNRIISTVPHHYEQVGEAAIGAEGLFTHLKGFDYVRVFRTVDTEGHERHYALYGNQQHPTALRDTSVFTELKQQHWHIEQAFRAVKQLVHAGHFFVRRTTAIQTHLFCVLRALQRLLLWAKDEVIQSVYKLHDQIFLHAQRQFIHLFA